MAVTPPKSRSERLAAAQHSLLEIRVALGNLLPTLGKLEDEATDNEETVRFISMGQRLTRAWWEIIAAGNVPGVPRDE